MHSLSLFSIVIPTYNRPAQLSACLASLARLDYPRHGFEVIVVDDGSRTSPQAVVKGFEHQCDVTLLRQANAGPATARNTGAKQARGEVIAFLDDDCVPAANWLTALAYRVAITPEAAIGGRVINALSHNRYSAASQLLIDYLYTYYNAHSDNASFFASNNLVFPTEHFRTIGGFDETFPLAAAEDRELCDRWRRYGYRMVYAPEALVYHAHRLTLRTFWRQHHNYGRGAYHYHHVRCQRYQEARRIEPLGFYLHLLHYPFMQVRGPCAVWYATLMLISQLANAAGFYRGKLL
jgi:GT2 family glycosyltransferase